MYGDKTHDIFTVGSRPPKAKGQTEVNVKRTVKSKADEGPVPGFQGELAIGLRHICGVHETALSSLVNESAVIVS